jgi:ABC-2 type transport system ATP-binding protein
MLSTHGLTKRYGAHAALQSLSLQVSAGQFVALLGPNGAGKSTLFQVLTGLFAADEGEVEVAGHSLRHAATAALRQIGVVFQQISLDLDLSVRRNLLFQADLHGLPRRLALQRSGWAWGICWSARSASCRAATGARSSWCAPGCTTRRCC